MSFVVDSTLNKLYSQTYTTNRSEQQLSCAIRLKKQKKQRKTIENKRSKRLRARNFISK